MIYSYEKSLRLKGKIVGNLKKIDNKNAILTIEVEFPTRTEIDWCPYEERRSGYSRFWYVPDEITVYFHDKPKGDFISRLSRSQLEVILTKAVSDGKLKLIVLLRWQGGVDKFSKKEIEIIRQYITPETEMLPVPKDKRRMLRPKKQKERKCEED